jgi:hypothetical protein
MSPLPLSWDRKDVIPVYHDYLSERYEDAQITMQDMKAYKAAVEDPRRPIDLGMLRWIRETRGVRFRFFCVWD